MHGEWIVGSMDKYITPGQMHRWIGIYIGRIEGLEDRGKLEEVSVYEQRIAGLVEQARLYPAPEKMRLCEPGDFGFGEEIWKVEEGKSPYWYTVSKRWDRAGGWFIDAEEEWIHRLDEGVYYVADEEEKA